MFKAAFDQAKRLDKEVLENLQVQHGEPSKAMFELTKTTVMGALLFGRLHSVDKEKIKLDDGITINFETKPETLPFEEALEFLRTLISTPKSEWADLERKLQFRCFTVAALAEADSVEAVRLALIRAIENGKTVGESWEELGYLSEALGNKFAPGYWETIYRTNVQTAYNAGRLMQYRDNMPPAWELLFIQDKRQSDHCRGLSHLVGGKAIPRDHHFWQTYGYPPYHFNCRTSFRAVYDYELKGGEIAVVKPTKTALKKSFRPGEGFGGNPLEKESWWKLTPSMLERAAKFGILDAIKKQVDKFDMKSFFPDMVQGFETVYIGKKKGGYVQQALNYEYNPYELEATKKLADLGHQVYLLPRTRRTKSPDMIIDNEIGEIKTIGFEEKGATLNTMQSEFREAGKDQRARFVYIVLEEKLNIEDMIQATVYKIHMTPVKRVFIQQGSLVREYPRSYFFNLKKKNKE